MSDFLQPHGLQHSRLVCASLSSGVCTNSRPLSWWCYLTNLFNPLQKTHSNQSLEMQKLRLSECLALWPRSQAQRLAEPGLETRSCSGTAGQPQGLALTAGELVCSTPTSQLSTSEAYKDLTPGGSGCPTVRSLYSAPMETKSPDIRIQSPKPQILDEKKKSILNEFTGTFLFRGSGGWTNWRRRETYEHQPRECKVQAGHMVPGKMKSKVAETGRRLVIASGWGRVVKSDCLTSEGFPSGATMSWD